jgi:hypothetical protein
MSRAVSSSDPSRTRSWLVAVAVFVACFWCLDLGVLRAGAPDPLDDTWEYGVAARHLLAGQGFRTRVIHPPLWTLRDASSSVPILVHGPLVPLLVAPLVATHEDRALDGIAWLAALFAGLAAVITFRLGSRLADPALGAAAALAFTLAPDTLRAVHHDISPILGAALLGLALDLALRERPRALAAGLVIGGGALVRPELLLALPVLAIALPGRRVRFSLAALCVVAPWAWHTVRATGSPFFNLSSYLAIGYWGARPELSPLRDFGLPPSRWPAALATALPTLPAKWATFFVRAAGHALTTPSIATGILAAVGGGWLIARRETRRFAWVALMLALIPIAVMTIMLHDPRYLVPFLPLWAIGTAFGARVVLQRLPAWAHAPRFEIGLLALLMLPSILPALVGGAREAPSLRGRLARERIALHALAGADHDRLMFSDTPDFVSWTTGRPVVWVTRDEYARLPAAPPGGDAGLSRPSRSEGETWFHRSPAPVRAPARTD